MASTDIWKFLMIMILINFTIAVVTTLNENRISSTYLGEDLSNSLSTQTDEYGNPTGTGTLYNFLTTMTLSDKTDQEGIANDLSNDYNMKQTDTNFILSFLDSIINFLSAFAKIFDIIGAVVVLTIFVSLKLGANGLESSMWLMIITLPMNIAQISILMKLLLTSMRV